MNEKIKNALGISIITTLIVIIVSIIVVVYTFTQVVDPSSNRNFSVSGKGEINTIPDVATLSFSIITEGGINIEKLQKENSEKMNKILEKAKQRGVDKKDIKTTNYQVTPRYSYSRCNFGETCPPSKITGYTVRQSISLKIRNFDIIGTLLTDAASVGINSVSGPYFKVENEENAKNDAREKAIARAKEKAEAMAKAGGFRLGRLISIREGGNYSPEPYLRAGGAESISIQKTTPTIEPGSQDVTVNITLTYEIK